jgi:hypothetical protein
MRRETDDAKTFEPIRPRRPQPFYPPGRASVSRKARKTRLRPNKRRT